MKGQSSRGMVPMARGGGVSALRQAATVCLALFNQVNPESAANAVPSCAWLDPAYPSYAHLHVSSYSRHHKHTHPWVCSNIFIPSHTHVRVGQVYKHTHDTHTHEMYFCVLYPFSDFCVCVCVCVCVEGQSMQ